MDRTIHIRQNKFYKSKEKEEKKHDEERKRYYFNRFSNYNYRVINFGRNQY